MGTASKQPSKKEVRVPPRRTGQCPICNKTVPLDKMQNHIGSMDCR